MPSNPTATADGFFRPLTRVSAFSAAGTLAVDHRTTRHATRYTAHLRNDTSPKRQQGTLCPLLALRAGLVYGGSQPQANSLWTTLPWTSVRRKSRPWKRNVNF